MALSAAGLIAVMIKSAYLSISWVDLSSGTSPELSATSRIDSNTSLSVWLNLYLMELVCVCSFEVEHLLRFQWEGDCSPGCHLLETVCHVWLSFTQVIWMPWLRCLCCLFSCPDVCAHHYLNKLNLDDFEYFWALDQRFFLGTAESF